MRIQRAIFSLVLCAVILGIITSGFSNASFAQSKKKKKKKSESSVKLAPASNFRPTMTGAPGTVKYYFFPTTLGTQWKMRTVQLLLDQEGKLARADTLYSESTVVDSSRFSLQHLPLMVTSDTSYKTSGIGVRSESEYYVDDSVAMTVTNHSVTNGDNRFFLVAPLTLRNAWHEKYGDTTVTIVAGFADSLLTPIGKLDHILITLTELENTDMRKYFARGHGIVKTIFRSPGPGGRGLVIVTTEMVAFKPATEN